MTNKILIFLALLFSPSIYAEETIYDVCQQYYQLMKSIPHISVKIDTEAQFISMENNKKYSGCAVETETKWSLVGKEFNQSSVLELPGWKYGKFAADGPGSSISGMVKNNMFCFVSYHFSSYIDVEKNDFVSGDELNMKVRCAIK